MDTKAGGQIGGVDSNEEARKTLAKRSQSWKCGVCCTKNNREIMEECAAEAEGSTRKDEEVPQELRMLSKEELDKEKEEAQKQKNAPVQTSTVEEAQLDSRARALPGTASANTPNQAQARPLAQGQVQVQRQVRNVQSRDDWLDKVIYGVAILLAFFVARKMLMLG
jgi:ubiquitin-conjugating enzyme E2 J1